MKRNDIPGQETLKAVFTRMVDDGKLPHAMLLHSREGGVGLALALFLTTYLLCDEPQDGDVCGECDHCKKNAGLTHADVHFVVPINTVKKLKRENMSFDNFAQEWREAVTTNPFLSLSDWYSAIGIEKKSGLIAENDGTVLRKKMTLRAREGKSKVFIIWHADKMNPTFANKMLKSLEEPSEHTHLIVVSEQPEKLLTTILSRLQRFKEEVLHEPEMASFLERAYNIDPLKAKAVAFRSEGMMGEAVRELMENEDRWLMDFRAWMRMAYSRDLVGLYKWCETMSKHPRDTQREFIVSALKTLDRCFRLGWLDIQVPMEGEEAAFYQSFSPFINAANIREFMEMLDEASEHISRNMSGIIVWYDCSIRAVRFIHAGKKAVAES